VSRGFSAVQNFIDISEQISLATGGIFLEENGFLYHSLDFILEKIIKNSTDDEYNLVRLITEEVSASRM